MHQQEEIMLETERVHPDRQFKYMRKCRRESYARMMNGCKKIVPKSHSFFNSTILPIRHSNEAPTFGLGGCLNEQNLFIELSGIPNCFGGPYNYNECLSENLKVVYLGAFNSCWGHFLLDTCARVWYCLKDDTSIDKYVILMNEGDSDSLENNYKNFFELLGIWDKILLINKPTKFKEVIIPEVGIRKSEYYSDEYGLIIEKIVDKALSLNTNNKKYTGVFLSRSKWKKNEFGCNALDSFFKKNGYKVVYPETMSLTDLICLINNANNCVSISGSTSHNFVFLKSHSSAAVIERQAIPDAYVTGICLSRKLEYTFIDAHISLFPVHAGGGPVIYCYNKYIDNYAADNNMKRSSIERGIIINNRVRKYIRNYMDSYPIYPDAWVVVDLYDCFKEGYDEAKREYGYAISKTSGLKRLKYLFPMIMDYLIPRFR